MLCAGALSINGSSSEEQATSPETKKMSPIADSSSILVELWLNGKCRGGLALVAFSRTDVLQGLYCALVLATLHMIGNSKVFI